MTPEEHLVAPVNSRGLKSGEIDNLALRLYSLLPDEMAFGSRDETAKTKRRLYKGMGPLVNKQPLVALAKRQELLVQDAARRGLEPAGPFTLKLTSRLTCGMSQATALENGMTLLRPYGVPVLPASSIKGIMSSWLAEILAGRLNLRADKEDDREDKVLRAAGFLRLFGSSTESGQPGKDDGIPGQVVFFDSLPKSASLEVDITTVHYQSWYQSETNNLKAPSGFENPISIPFLTVGPGTCFVFWFLAPKAWKPELKLTDEDCSRLRDWKMTNFDTPGTFLHQLLVSTGLFRGFGSQTAKGYGRLEECK